MKTVEELTAELEEQRAQNEAMNAQNRKLLDEMKKVKKQISEVDLDSYHKVLDGVDVLEQELSKRDGVIKTMQKDLEKASEENGKSKAFIHKSVLTDGLGKALLEAGVDQKFLPAAQAMLEKTAKVVQNGDDYSALIGDVPANDFVKSWVENEGKIFTMVQPDTGAGARGGNPNGGVDAKKYFDKTSPEFSLTKQAEIMKNDPTLYNSLKG